MKTQMNHLSSTHRSMNLFLAFALSVFVALAIVIFVKVYQKAHYYPTTSIPNRTINTNVNFAMAEFQLPEVVVYGSELLTSNNTTPALDESNELFNFATITMPALSQYLQPGQNYFGVESTRSDIFSTIAMPASTEYLQPGQIYYDAENAQDTIDKTFI